MNILNKTFYCINHKKGAQIRRWGRILDISNSHVTIYNPSAPLGSKLYKLSNKQLASFINTKLIFTKEQI